jgi:hypothetical protein
MTEMSVANATLPIAMVKSPATKLNEIAADKGFDHLVVEDNSMSDCFYR